MSSPSAAPDHVPVERFKPTNGSAIGYVGLALIVLLVGYLLLVDRSATGFSVALAAAFFGVVIWVTQVRPRAVAYPHRLLLRNSVRDTEVPLALIDQVSVRQTLNVWVGDRRFVCIGIGDSVRSMLKQGRKSQSSLLGTGRWGQFSEMAERAAPDQTAMPYQAWVVSRIEELAEQERRSLAGRAAEGEVRRLVAWPEVVAMVVLALAFAGSLVL
jgi:hypothetical protein